MLIMLTMFLDRANMLKNFFSAIWWVPLSRLTYLTYLILPIINSILMSSMSASLFLSYMTVLALVWFNFVFCMIAAFVLHILIEAPVMNLILSRKIRESERNKNTDKMMLFYLKDHDRTRSHIREQDRTMSELSKKSAKSQP